VNSSLSALTLSSIFFIQSFLSASICLADNPRPSHSVKGGQGCEDVAYAKARPSEYTPEALRQRLQRNPEDVDALVNLGTRLEEQGQPDEAYVLYQKAIRSKPDCYLGYYFTAFVEETISGRRGSDAIAKIRKAVALDPSLGSDPNVEAFVRRHSELSGVAYREKIEPSPKAGDLFTSANRFLVGVGVGILLVLPFLYVARRRRVHPS